MDLHILFMLLYKTTTNSTEIAAFIKLARSHRLFVNGWCLSSWYSDWLRWPKSSWYPVCVTMVFDEDTPIGICLFHTYCEPLDNFNVAFYVKPKYRRQGIAKDMFSRTRKAYATGTPRMEIGIEEASMNLQKYIA